MRHLDLFDEFTGRMQSRWRLALAIFLYVAMISVSSLVTAHFFTAYRFDFNAGAVPAAAIWAAAFAPVFLLFVAAEFSFGYFIGLYFAGMVLGYLWLNHFSDYGYGRTTAQVSAILSAVAFLLPALFVSSPTRPQFALSEPAFERMLTLIFWLSVALLLVAATCNFRLVTPAAASSARVDSFPSLLRYLLGATLSTALPFVFACDVARRKYWRAGAALLVFVLYYPVVLAKTTLFAPAWLLFVVVLLRLFEARLVVVLTLLVPGLIGLLMIFPQGGEVAVPSSYFFNVNFRMLAIPSIAMDVYNEFFSKHDLTYFCQIGMLKPFVGCPYNEQLAVVMRENFPFGGSFNASLFATEGIASVGNWLAPIPVLAAGLIVALANRVSVGLPPAIVLVSSAIFCQILLNVPFSTALLSYGGGLLFLLWYVTPRTLFPRQQRSVP